MKSEDICFLAGKLWQTQTVYWKAETLLCLQRSIYSQGYGFPSGHVWLWELDCKEGRVLKNWCLQTMVLEKTSKSPLYSKKIKPVSLTGDQPVNIHWKDWCWSWSSNTLVIDVNRWLIGKVPDAGKDCGRKEKKASEDETARWHYWCNEHELGWTLLDGKGQGGLACCSPWGHKGSDTTGWLNNSNRKRKLSLSSIRSIILNVVLVLLVGLDFTCLNLTSLFMRIHNIQRYFLPEAQKCIGNKVMFVWYLTLLSFLSLRWSFLQWVYKLRCCK